MDYLSATKPSRGLVAIISPPTVLQRHRQTFTIDRNGKELGFVRLGQL